MALISSLGDGVSISSDGAAAVDHGFFWRKVDQYTPRGVKVQLINKPHGVAVYGHYKEGAGWTHWAPLPKFRVGD